MHSMGAAILQWTHCELERRTRDVDVVVLNTHGVDAQLVGNKVDSKQTVLKLGDRCLGYLRKMIAEGISNAFVVHSLWRNHDAVGYL